MASVNGRDQFNFHTQLKPGESEQISDAEAKAMFETAFAAPLDIEIIARSAWNAGYTLVAEKVQRGRIFLRRDAAQLVTPARWLAYDTPARDAVNSYQPTGCPGGRAPHLWLGDGRSLYDALGFEFTLVQLGAKSINTAPFRAAAAAMNIPLSVVAIASDEARELYGADLALI